MKQHSNDLRPSLASPTIVKNWMIYAIGRQKIHSRQILLDTEIEIKIQALRSSILRGTEFGNESIRGDL